ncbi:hypothetical protein A4G86_20730 [Burkholderia pseudomallei]|nr:hypothetical protein A4G86_20730 [Burkholderia pseudomallei]
MIDAYLRALGNWLDVSMRDDTGDVLGILRQSECHIQPVACFGMSRISRHWIQFNESEKF